MRVSLVVSVVRPPFDLYLYLYAYTRSITIILLHIDMHMTVHTKQMTDLVNAVTLHVMNSAFHPSSAVAAAYV